MGHIEGKGNNSYGYGDTTVCGMYDNNDFEANIKCYTCDRETIFTNSW